MSTTATKFTKTLVSGTKGTLVLEPGVLFSRKTSLPANWNHIRLGIFFSFTDTVGFNNVPVVETMPLSNNLQRFALTLSNGVGYVGDTGNQSLGFLTTRENQIFTDGTNWFLGADSSHTSTLIGGAAVTSGASVSINETTYPNGSFGNPANSSGCFMGLALDLNLTTATQLSMSYAAINAASTAGDSDLTALIVGGTYYAGSAQGGGWWNGSTPVNCQYLNIRSPFTNNRLRLHNMMVIDMTA